MSDTKSDCAQSAIQRLFCLMGVAYPVGSTLDNDNVVFEIDEITDRVAEMFTELTGLKAERYRLLKEKTDDTNRLDFLISRSAYLSHSRDGDVCNVWYRWDDEGQDGGPVEGYPQKCYSDAREAIDAAARKETE